MQSSARRTGWSGMQKLRSKFRFSTTLSRLVLASAVLQSAPITLAQTDIPATADGQPISTSELSQNNSLPALHQRAAAGDSAAQFELGNRYLYGTDIEQDNFAAASWFRQAAQQGNHNAQYNLGVMALNGIGVIADFKEALEWFHLAAENADTTAQFTLGVIYANGRGIPQDLTQAHMWFTVAAAGGEQSAAVNAVLFQEMLSTEQLEKSQHKARILIEKFNQRQ
jgi:TPR repeat protein